MPYAPPDDDDADDGKETFREAVILEGDTVSVLGLARWVAAPDAPDTDSYRESPKRLVISAPPNGSLLISADTA